MPELSRRAALRLGLGAFTGAVGITAVNSVLDPFELQASPSQFDPTPAGNDAPTKISGSFVSAARGGVLTNWIIARPPGQTGPLRPVIALHGIRGNAKQVMDLGVEDGLAELVKAGRPPFAMVAVDGGDSYWHRRASGEDSGAMVLTELIPLLATMGLDISRVGFIGWSMGGYGAMLLGSRLGPQRTAGICAVSPALYQSFTGSTRGAFDSYDDWTRNTVFGLPALSSIPLRVDCGNNDRFAPATHQFIAQLRRAPSGGFSAGGHDVSFWREQLPGELAWLAS
ncbi:alpha/beta hydrolase [Candidatus Mycobacterium methanotrophicum]|uniref:Alpha/beta hydrolase-fold protein n=1 Tax=Candidatus Mycobacterium methanotrophicum TaxID=2943498 RepID=A0ABY4QQH7_9MYCO|nr:alpha/beta hydrolase-fold protein [Candidatus Mycobacterium methanotrophicum]UQX12018.1 alpha/beta hydrolase-fold protein [Candidatus Mycobacterium methanotrophicum]